MDGRSKLIATLSATPFQDWDSVRGQAPSKAAFEAAAQVVVDRWTRSERHSHARQALVATAADLIWAGLYLPTGLARFAALLFRAECLIGGARQLVLPGHRPQARGDHSAPHAAAAALGAPRADQSETR